MFFVKITNIKFSNTLESYLYLNLSFEISINTRIEIMEFQLMFLSKIGGAGLLLILAIVLLLFGGKKIPELMKGLGKGVKEFKDATNGKEEEKSAKE